MDIRTEDFWRLTARELWALMERKRDAEKRADFRAGTVCATMANIHAEKKSHPYTAEDFFSTLVVADKPSVWDPEETLRAFEAAALLL